MSTKRTKPPRSFKSSTTIPSPFAKPPETVLPLLERFDPSKIHITHIDRHPIAHKRTIFLIPVLLNGLIASLLLWRLVYAIPTYWTLLQTLLGYATSATVDSTATTRKDQFTILARRFAMMVVDYALVRLVGPWPVTFFLEQPANPVTWRWNIGFRDAEVVVRVSRHWETSDLMQGAKRGEENPFFKTRILPAIQRDVMREKTGYLMMNKDWDLEFEVMQDAHTLVERKELELGDVDKVVWAFQEGTGWLCWRWEGEGQVDVVEERRKKVVAFKERLTALGKESLFWRWTEIVEEERDRDGGFTPERQQRVAKRVEREFEKNGVDFDEVIKSIGGLEDISAPSSK